VAQDDSQALKHFLFSRGERRTVILSQKVGRTFVDRDVPSFSKAVLGEAPVKDADVTQAGLCGSLGIVARALATVHLLGRRLLVPCVIHIAG